jgi:hypothetical protein
LDCSSSSTKGWSIYGVSQDQTNLAMFTSRNGTAFGVNSASNVWAFNVRPPGWRQLSKSPFGGCGWESMKILSPAIGGRTFAVGCNLLWVTNATLPTGPLQFFPAAAALPCVDAASSSNLFVFPRTAHFPRGPSLVALCTNYSDPSTPTSIFAFTPSPTGKNGERGYIRWRSAEKC